MLGAIIGDIVGSQHEWQNNKSKKFPFFTGACHYTDDSLMTLAIAQAFVLRRGRWREEDFQQFVIDRMVEMGRAHQACSWGKHFYEWFMYNPVPYNSYEYAKQDSFNYDNVIFKLVSHLLANTSLVKKEAVARLEELFKMLSI